MGSTRATQSSHNTWPVGYIKKQELEQLPHYVASGTQIWTWQSIALLFVRNSAAV
jgi:hypothetical protein